MHSVFLDAVAPEHLKKGELNSSSVGSFSLSTWVTKPYTRFVLERTTHCSLLCSHLFGRGFKQTIHIMLNTGQTLKSSISLCPVVLVLSFFFNSSLNTKCDDLGMWWLCWVGGFFVCSTHCLHSSNFIYIYSAILRPKDKKIPDRQFINSSSSILWIYCIPSSTGLSCLGTACPGHAKYDTDRVCFCH